MRDMRPPRQEGPRTDKNKKVAALQETARKYSERAAAPGGPGKKLHTDVQTH